MSSRRRKNEEPTVDLVSIGEIIKPHSVKGEVKVLPYSGQPENFKNYERIYLQPREKDTPGIYRVLESRVQGKLVIVALEGITSRERAAELQGCTVLLNRDDFQRPGPDEYYWHQLENLRVITESGRDLGRVSRIIRTAAHDIMIVTGRGHEYMIPFKADIISNVNEQERQIVISPPEGLLDLNT